MLSLYGHYTGIIINIDNNYKCLKKNLSYFYDDCNPNHDLLFIEEYKKKLLSNYPYILCYIKDN